MKKYELGVREFLTRTWLIAALCLPAGVAQAESKAGQEVPPGTIIDASTYDDLKDALFEGKRIGDMILPQKEFQIRNEGARMELVATQANDNDYRVMQATERYKGTAKVDMTKRPGMTDPVARIDIALYCHQQGHALDTRDEGKAVRFTVTKSPIAG